MPDRTPSPDDLLTTSQAAATAGVDRTTFRKWAREGLVPSSRTPGGHRRYRRADVEAVRIGGLDTMGRSEAAALLRVSPFTVTLWANLGKLPCSRTLGGHRRYARVHVETVLRGGNPGSADA